MDKLISYLVKEIKLDPTLTWKIKAGSVNGVVDVVFMTTYQKSKTQISVKQMLDEMLDPEIKRQIELTKSYKVCHPLKTDKMQAFTIKCEV